MALINGGLSRRDVEDILQSIIEELNLKNPNIEAASTKGGGYMSFLMRVVITSENNEDLNLIIKLAPKQVRNLMPLRPMFLREIYFYNTVVKQFDELYKQRNFSKKSFTLPKCFKTVDEEGNEHLIIENMTLKGYRMWNRKKQMDEEHINLVLKKFAKFHAASYAIKHFNANRFDEITRNLQRVFRSENTSLVLYEKIVSNARYLCSNFIHELDVSISNALEKYLEDLGDLLLFIEKRKYKDYVIVHGDGWCNNMLFKYEKKADKEKPADICFLDFQLTRFASPLEDLSFFFHLSASKDILYNYKHHLMLYYKELKDHYLEFGGDPNDFLKFNELLDQWKMYTKCFFPCTLFIWKAMHCDDEEAQDITDLTEKDIELMDMFCEPLKNDNITQQMAKTLVIYMYDNDLF